VLTFEGKCSTFGTVSILVKAGQEERKSCFFCARRNDEKQQISSSINKIETEPLFRAFTIALGDEDGSFRIAGTACT
jgi:hypothetical protein